jgi:hypothetical protein
MIKEIVRMTVFFLIIREKNPDLAVAVPVIPGVSTIHIAGTFPG